MLIIETLRTNSNHVLAKSNLLKVMGENVKWRRRNMLQDERLMSCRNVPTTFKTLALYNYITVQKEQVACTNGRNELYLDAYVLIINHKAVFYVEKFYLAFVRSSNNRI